MTPKPQLPDALVEERYSAVSALADGEADAADEACALWRSDPSARAKWHAYHLIGDVLRSDDLAHEPAGDTAFLKSFQARLAAEPVVLAPSPVAPLRRPRWMVPAAVAAGVMAVAGVLVVSRMQMVDPSDGAPRLAVGPAPLGGVFTRAAVGARPNETLVIDGRLIRDAQLDRYLRAHREMRGSAAGAVPGGAMRSVDTLAPAR